MIKSFLHKLFSGLLALLVLFSTFSFTVEKHYCGNSLIDVALFSEVEKCAMEDLEMEMTKITKKSCCKDVVDIIEGQDELNVKSFDDLKYNTQLFVAAFIYSYVNLFEGLPEQVIPFKEYSPPNLVIDIGIRDQVFLI